MYCDLIVLKRGHFYLGERGHFNLGLTLFILLLQTPNPIATILKRFSLYLIVTNYPDAKSGQN